MRLKINRTTNTKCNVFLVIAFVCNDINYNDKSNNKMCIHTVKMTVVD